jgi:hypothetical protein
MFILLIRGQASDEYESLTNIIESMVQVMSGTKPNPLKSAS